MCVSHVSKTGDIKRFCIMEETSIAKGIRRIVGVTGEEAFKVQATAQIMESKIKDLEKLSHSDLEAALKVIAKELDVAYIPVVSKNQLKERFTEIKKTFDDADKARKAKEVKEAVDLIKSIYEQNPEQKVLVKVLPTGNTKALAQAITHVKGMSNTSALLFAIDGEKVSHQCVVSKVNLSEYSPIRNL
jgi:alanyl-tRNA synthetase